MGPQGCKDGLPHRNLFALEVLTNVTFKNMEAIYICVYDMFTHVWMCVQMCTCSCLSVHMWEHVEARGLSPMSSLIALHLIWKGLPLNLEFTDLARLTSQYVLEIFLSLTSQHQGNGSMPPSPASSVDTRDWDPTWCFHKYFPDNHLYIPWKSSFLALMYMNSLNIEWLLTFAPQRTPSTPISHLCSLPVSLTQTPPPPHLIPCPVLT